MARKKTSPNLEMNWLLYYRVKDMRDELGDLTAMDPRTLTDEQMARACELEDHLWRIGLALRALGEV